MIVGSYVPEGVAVGRWVQETARGVRALYDIDTPVTLAKLERGHRKDRDDVESMIRDGLVDPKRLEELFLEVEASLYRYPAIDPKSLRAAVTRLASR